MSYDALQARAYDTAFGEHPSVAHSIRLAGLEPTDVVLDVGCGGGHALALVAALGATAIGIDPSPSMLAIARERLGPARLVVGRCEALPMVQGSVSVVLLINTVHHIRDVDLGLAECRRVLRPGGRLLITWESGPHTLSPAAVHEAAVRSGLADVRWHETRPPGDPTPMWVAHAAQNPAGR